MPGESLHWTLLRCVVDYRLTHRHIRQLAENHNVPMPTMDVAHQHMLSARAHGGDQMDWTALVGGERISAGLQPFGSRVS